jgi:hypothetical protein
LNGFDGLRQERDGGTHCGHVSNDAGGVHQ